MFCSKCKAEYREGIKMCPECGIELVPYLPEEKEEAVIVPDEKAVEIYNAADDFEADIIIAKLKAEGIYAYKAYKGIDSYNKILLGRTLLGVKVFVGESHKEEAEDILSAQDL